MAGPFGEPKEVRLALGNYKIKARYNGHGLVTIPVKIVADRETTVHLESRACPRSTGRGDGYLMDKWLDAWDFLTRQRRMESPVIHSRGF